MLTTQPDEIESFRERLAELSVPPPDPWMQRLRVATALTFLFTGAGLSIGPTVWRSSSSFYVLRMVPGGMRTIGGVFVALGLAQLVFVLRRNCSALHVSLAVGAGLASAVAVAQLAAAAFGQLVAISGPILWAFLALAQVFEAERPTRRGR
jgi:uncharacterized protein YjeT (DUF2065 family)